MRKIIFNVVVMLCLIFIGGSVQGQNTVLTDPQFEIVEEYLADFQMPFIHIVPSYYTLNNKIYIFGGRDPNPGSSYVSAHDEIRVFDLLSLEWSILPFKLPYEYCFDGVAASFFNNHFYIPPGFATGNSGGWGSHNKIIDVDFLNKTAVETHAFPTSSRIWSIGNCEANGKIYFFSSSSQG